MKIGIIGAENSHTVAIGKMINIDCLVKGFTVDYVWGETAEFASKAAQDGKVPNVVRHPKEMLGKIDALVVDHRHPKYHLKAAEPFIEAGIPVFIDKPFCHRVAEGKKFLTLAKKNNIPVTSHSALPLQKSFLKFKSRAGSIGTLCGGVSYGPCDVKSQYGGIFFYGIHQVDMILGVFGYDVHAVRAVQHGANAVAEIFYKIGPIVVMHLIKEGLGDFYMAAIGEKEVVQQKIEFDKYPQLAGTKRFTNMFRTRVAPLSHAQILKPVAVLEALEKSLKSEKIEKIEG